MQLTTNYGFKKPDQADNVNIEDINYNMDIADTEIKKANAQLAEKANTAQEAWINITLLNGWTNTNTAQYYKDNLGVVHLRGRITGGNATASANITQLPVGYRPNVATYVCGVTYSSATDLTPCLLNINTDGVISLSFACKTVIVLDVSFRIA